MGMDLKNSLECTDLEQEAVHAGLFCTNWERKVSSIRCLFWNINKKNLVQELSEIVFEHNIDIVMIAEAENFDAQYFISRLRKCGRNFEKKEILQRQSGIMLFADTGIWVSVYKEEKYFKAYKVHEQDKNRLLIAVHLTSALRYSETARNQRAAELSGIFGKLEEVCNLEAEKEGKSRYDTIIAGDFNLHPFSTGVIGMHGFNAVMDLERARKKYRKFHGREIKFYYNPMWNLMGKRNHALGTYFHDSDQDDKSFYWYTFDQVLIRPGLIDEFVWDEFEILDHIGTDSLICSHRINRKKYSDHLPVKFAIC